MALVWQEHLSQAHLKKPQGDVFVPSLGGGRPCGRLLRLGSGLPFDNIVISFQPQLSDVYSSRNMETFGKPHEMPLETTQRVLTIWHLEVWTRVALCQHCMHEAVTLPFLLESSKKFWIWHGIYHTDENVLQWGSGPTGRWQQWFWRLVDKRAPCLAYERNMGSKTWEDHSHGEQTAAHKRTGQNRRQPSSNFRGMK